MVFNPAFDIKLREGEAREDAFARILGGELKVEVKSDVKSRQTGNVFIEFEQHGTKSGIATTTADYWAIETFVDRWIVIKTEELRRIARRIYKKCLKVNCAYRGTPGGDNGNVGVLVPITDLFQNLQ